MATMESGWLVEKGPIDSKHFYVGIDEGELCWTDDSLKALRLARKEDAEALQTMFRSGEVRVAEHGWSDFRSSDDPSGLNERDAESINRR